MHAAFLSLHCVWVKRSSLASKNPRSPQRESIQTTRLLSRGDKRKCTAQLGFSGDLPRVSAENFLTLKELWVHLSSTYTACRSTGPASICLWAMGKRFASKTHSSHSALPHLLLTVDLDTIFILRLAIYNKFKWPIHIWVCKQTHQWDGSGHSLWRLRQGWPHPAHYLNRVISMNHQDLFV